jgi:hypothetical protein
MRVRAAAALLGFALAACAGAPSPPPRASASAGPPLVTQVRVTPGGVDGHPWLDADATRAASAGAGALQIVGADLVGEGDRVGGFVEVPSDECLLAFARPSPTVADVDLFAFEDDGSVFAADESPDPQAAILACPPHPRRLYVVARVMAGSGVLAVGVQPVPRASADAVAKTMRARGRPGEDTGRLDAWPGLEAKIRAHRDGLGGRWEDVRRVVVAADPRAATRVSVPVDAGRCLDVLVTPSEEVASLEMVVEDASARIVARGRDQGRDRASVLCAGTGTTVTVAVRPRGTPGLAAVIVGRSAVGGEGEIADASRVVHLSASAPLEEARRALAAELGATGWALPTPVATGTARIGSRSVVAVTLPNGCARLDVVAGKPLVEVGAALWDDKGALLGEGRAGASLPLFTCGKGGAARLDIEAVESPGPFAIELRKDKSAPAPLVAHPLAAGRLLARMNAGGRASDAASAAGASVVALDETSLRSLPVPVPSSQCVEVIAALDGGASGLDLRLVDGAGEGSVTRGRYVATDRICSTPGGKAGMAELRLLAGKGDALVVMRVVSP